MEANSLRVWAIASCIAPLRIFTACVKTNGTNNVYQFKFINHCWVWSFSLTYTLFGPAWLGLAWLDQSSYTQNQSLQIAHISKYETPDDKKKRNMKNVTWDTNQNGMPFILWNLFELARAHDGEQLRESEWWWKTNDLKYQRNEMKKHIERV